jgi:tRNA (guanine37-N1)-methyltransferase
MNQSICFDVMTIFPEMFDIIHAGGVVGRALEKQLFKLNTWNPRDYTTDNRKTVDDRAYGGGPGMVMMVEPLEKTLQAIKALQGNAGLVVLLSPQGKVFNQDLAQDLLSHEQITMICGRYEAVDQRFIDRNVDLEISLGDFVLSGGEIAAMAIIDTMARLIPGVLGDKDSALQDSFMEGLLDHPHYTRPENYENSFVPGVLLGGNHAIIEGWRREQSLLATQKSRPDLIEVARKKGLLSKKDELFLKSIGT